MILPRRVANSSGITPAWANHVVEYLRTITLRPSTEILVQQGAGGTTLVLNRRQRGGSVSVTHPFQLYNASTSEELRIGVIPGSIGNVWPSGMETPGTEYALTVTASGSVWIGGTVDANGLITSVYLDTTEPVQNNTTFKLLVGSFTVTGTQIAINQSIQGSQGYIRCLQLYTSPLTYSHQFTLV